MATASWAKAFLLRVLQKERNHCWSSNPAMRITRAWMCKRGRRIWNPAISSSCLLRGSVNSSAAGGKTFRAITDRITTAGGSSYLGPLMPSVMRHKKKAIRITIAALAITAVLVFCIWEFYPNWLATRIRNTDALWTRAQVLEFLGHPHRQEHANMLLLSCRRRSYGTRLGYA